MIPNLDVDVLKTFIAITETGSFTRAAEEVHKTQGAVSMQMKRLEETLNRALFVRVGRRNQLTADGERILDYARRIVRLNDEALFSFSDPGERTVIRFGTPDDYADRILPDVLAGFARSHPTTLLEVECLTSKQLEVEVEAGNLDLAIITCEDQTVPSDFVREERLCWVASRRHYVQDDEVLPIALSQTGCAWRQMALNALDRASRPYRIAYVSTNSVAIDAAVLAGLAVAAIPEIVMRPGMRILSEADGLPDLGTFKIGLMRGHKKGPAIEALARHISASLGAIERPVMAAE